jgi:hypothetical protein
MVEYAFYHEKKINEGIGVLELDEIDFKVNYNDELQFDERVARKTKH